ncbi:MAG: N-formylglutamate amidohydrolase [Geminicoccaceae bacterium]
MTRLERLAADSGHPAVRRLDPQGAAVPAVFDSPHSGLLAPADFAPMPSLQKLFGTADAYVDELFGTAPDHGAVLIAATFPRCYIDANRSPEQLDPAMIDGPWPGPTVDDAKIRRGVGLIWRHLPSGEAFYDAPLPRLEVERRIERYWRPYHAALQHAIDRAHARFGAVWHLNCHSMRSHGTPRDEDGARQARPDMVLGDRDGTTCDAAFLDLVRGVLAGFGFEVAINRPYKGQELVRRYADPANNRHSLQIEINRALYMERTGERSANFPRLRAQLSELVEAICGFAAAEAASLQRHR